MFFLKNLGGSSIKMSAYSRSRLSSATMIKYVLSKKNPVKYFDVPDSDVIIPNSNVPFRKIFKLYSKSMTENEFTTLFFSKYKSSKMAWTSMGKNTTINQYFENFVNDNFKRKLNQINFVSVNRLDNGFCYAKLITSEKCVVILYYDVMKHCFQNYFPVRGNNFNHYNETPAAFTGADKFWIEQQTKETKIEIKDPKEAKSYFFMSNEMIEEEIKHYATIMDESEIPKEENERPESSLKGFESFKMELRSYQYF